MRSLSYASSTRSAGYYCSAVTADVLLSPERRSHPAGEACCLSSQFMLLSSLLRSGCRNSSACSVSKSMSVCERFSLNWHTIMNMCGRETARRYNSVYPMPHALSRQEGRTFPPFFSPPVCRKKMWLIIHAAHRVYFCGDKRHVCM